jgi:hypothetical protein
VVSPGFVIKLQKYITFAFLFLAIASFIHLTSKFGMIEVYKSQYEIIITSAFSIAVIAFGLAFTFGVKYAFFIGEESSVNFVSILVSHSTIFQSSNSTFKLDNSKVTGITLPFTLNILATCLSHLSKLPVISAIAVIIRFQRL